MKVLLIKMSSMGDIIHTFPAITEALQNIPNLQLDWVVEGAFSELVLYHPAVNRVICANLRQWRKRPIQTLANGTWRCFKQQLRARHYDIVIDAQGLLKSAYVTRLSQGEKWGFDAQSSREPCSSRVLDKRVRVSWQEHAIDRYRTLMAAALSYPLADKMPSYGLKVADKKIEQTPSVLLCHGTTWANKHWPEVYWRELAQRLSARGWLVELPHASEHERKRAERIAEGAANVTVLPAMSIMQLFERMIVRHQVFVAGDTGLSHLAAAANLPGVMLFGPTDPHYSGVPLGHVVNLSSDYSCAPCMQRSCQYAQQEGAIWPPCMALLTPAKVEQLLIKSLYKF